MRETQSVPRSGTIQPGNSEYHPLTLAVCSNRIENVRAHWKAYRASLKRTDYLLIIMDVAPSVAVESLKDEMERAGVMVNLNGRNLGLSASRNIALDRCRTDYLIFIDDDVEVLTETIESIRHTLNQGADIVGVRIKEPAGFVGMPWYISEGQLHYLAIHNPKARKLGTWGACMGLYIPSVRAINATFVDSLGRRGKKLQSGDDTTFLREMRAAGATERFLSEVHVYHNIPRERLTMRYMLRRAYWQGRSEQRRADALNGLGKEWRRFLETDAMTLRKLVLALMYCCAVLIGILTEWLTFSMYKLPTGKGRPSDVL